MTEVWLGARIAGPESGTFSSPDCRHVDAPAASDEDSRPSPVGRAPTCLDADARVPDELDRAWAMRRSHVSIDTEQAAASLDALTGRGRVVDRRAAPPACRDRRRGAARTSSSAASPAPAATPAVEPQRRRRRSARRSTATGAGSDGAPSGEPDRHRVVRARAARGRTRGCRATSTSSRRPGAPSTGASSGARTAHRSPPRSGPARTRGGDRAGRHRRRAGRWSGRAPAARAPSTRCANPAGRVPTATPTPARPSSDGRHITKSSGSRLFGIVGFSPPLHRELLHPVAAEAAERAEVGRGDCRSRPCRRRRRRGHGRGSISMTPRMSGMAPVARGSDHGGIVLSAAMSSSNGPSRRTRGRGSARPDAPRPRGCRRRHR